MSKVKKPVQIKKEINGKEYVAQLLPALDAFLAREEHENAGHLVVHLIDKCIVHPNITSKDFEHPNDIRDVGAWLLEEHFVDTPEKEQEVEKKSKEK